jgi:hypothetical protein
MIGTKIRNYHWCHGKIGRRMTGRRRISGATEKPRKRFHTEKLILRSIGVPDLIAGSKVPLFDDVDYPPAKSANRASCRPDVPMSIERAAHPTILSPDRRSALIDVQNSIR